MTVPSLTIFDLEFTAWEGSMASPLAGARRIQGSGADRRGRGWTRKALQIEASFDCLVRPRINSELSPYFENLTGISNAPAGESGVDFASAYRRFWLSPRGGADLPPSAMTNGCWKTISAFYGLEGPAAAAANSSNCAGWFAAPSLAIDPQRRFIPATDRERFARLGRAVRDGRRAFDALSATPRLHRCR